MNLHYLVKVLLLTLFVSGSICGQTYSGNSLPATTHRSDWALPISDVHTTTLIFPHDVVTVDRGTGDVLTQTLDEVTNIVKVKAAGEVIIPSSLTVITSGGMVYTFRAYYDPEPAVLTYHLAPLRSASGFLPPAHVPAAPTVNPISYSHAPAAYANSINVQSKLPISPAYSARLGADLHLPLSMDTFTNPMGMYYGKAVVNTRRMYNTSATIVSQAREDRVATDKQAGSRLTLEDIWIGDDVLYYRFTLACESAISYDIDFWRFYVVDAKQRKRTAVQERDVELLHVYAPDDNPTYIGSNTSRTFVVAVRKMTIPDKKRLVLEVFEEGGGRHHQIRIRNRHIVRARQPDAINLTQVK